MLIAGAVLVFGRFVVAFALLTVLSAHAISAVDDGAYEPEGLPTLTPYGWAEFCQRNPAECGAVALAPQNIEATSEQLALIERVNREVNRQIRPLSDLDHWGVNDRWDLPVDNLGDCEDYVLLKRKRLVDSGLPRQALLITIVKDEAGDGHAVLTARTSRGDVILDNMTDRVKSWRDTPYLYVKRQAQTQQNQWVSIGQPAAPRVASR